MGIDCKKYGVKQSKNVGENMIVVILGPYRSGTSLVSGIVKSLGGWSGDEDLRPPNISNPTGFNEEPGLDRLCKNLIDIPSHRFNHDPAEIIPKLTEWEAEMKISLPLESTFVFAKNPLLCLICEEFAKSWQEMKVISVERDLTHSIRSVKSRKWGWSDYEIEESLKKMIDSRALFLDSYDHLSVDYDKIIDKPEESVDLIIDYLGIEINENMREDAIGIVNPIFRRSNKKRNIFWRSFTSIYARLISWRRA